MIVKGLVFFNLYFSLRLAGWACNNHVAARPSLVSLHLSVCSAQCSCSPVSKWAEAARHPVWCDGGGGEQEFSGTLLCLGFLQRLLSQPGYQCHHTESHHHPVWWGQCPAVQLKGFKKKNGHCKLFDLCINVLLVTVISPIKWFQQKIVTGVCLCWIQFLYFKYMCDQNWKYGTYVLDHISCQDINTFTLRNP